jgi:hypothetical protein
MAHYLTVHHGKVLYCAIEEGFGYTLQEKVGRLKALHPSTSFISIYHTTKEVRFQGSNTHVPRWT